MMMDVGEDRSLFNLSSCAGYYVPIEDYKHYLNSYGLFNDFEEKMLDNVTVQEGKFKKEFNSELYCPICLIEKPHKTRHVKKANLCIREFQFYSNIFDKIVFYKNTKKYALICVLHILFLLVEVFSLIGNSKDQYTFYPLFYFIEFFFIAAPSHLKLLVPFNIFVLLCWILDATLLLVATYYGLTIDELMNPQHYPYLFRRSERSCSYHNPSDKGLFRNFKAILAR